MAEVLKIAGVVVTFNRKALLKICLDALSIQTFKPYTIFIVDNASTDGTKDAVTEWGYYNTDVNGIHFEYLLMPKNLGGAGGFYNGMKTAHQSNERFDGIWMMDDDGIPDPECLKNLVKYMPQYHQVGPMVISLEDKSKLAFDNRGDFSVENLKKKGKIVEDYMCPFNGILYSRKLVDNVGYPVPNLFIWGDETNYTLRTKRAGYSMYTVANAIHYHPSDRMEFETSLFGFIITKVPNKWKGYCYWRNTIYNDRNVYEKHSSFMGYIRYYMQYSYYLLFKKKSWSWFMCFNDAFFSGFKKEPDEGFRKYMK